jgi:hypothetical protein
MYDEKVRRHEKQLCIEWTPEKGKKTEQKKESVHRDDLDDFEF